MRGAFTDEAAEIATHEDLEMCRKLPVAGALGPPEEPEPGRPDRPPVEVRTRRGPVSRGPSEAARIVTLRDARKDGRGGGNHGSDPPP